MENPLKALTHNAIPNSYLGQFVWFHHKKHKSWKIPSHVSLTGTQAEKVIDQLKPSHGGKLQRIPVFFIAKRLTTQVLQLFPEVHKEQ
ncbi:hypothetical protein OsI_15950 [Oryza sativa Indica Group]|uniref:Uncharacterized protein n=1 Tax=Oryza sativa subsp. indica TaxID=39946 RepID=A2XTL8_ORYSI|nr:hypothetical protein OsI_15950 [Oryza sativa Indica Group]